MKVNEPYPNIIHVYHPSQQELGKTFIRFQEHYECPKFKGKIFTLKEYKKWYRATSEKGKKTGRFTYFSDVDGYNIPSTAFEAFLDGKFNPLTSREKKILDIIKDKTELYTVIGTHGQDKDHDATLKHEIGHGLYFLNPKYKKKVKDVLRKLPIKEKNQILKYLKSRQYHKDVFIDETHAFLLADLKFLRNNNIIQNDLSDIVQQLEKNFNKYIKRR